MRRGESGNELKAAAPRISSRSAVRENIDTLEELHGPLRPNLHLASKLERQHKLAFAADVSLTKRVNSHRQRAI
jgi:hypothetical protein